MKNLSLALNAVSLILIAVLFSLHFSGKQKPGAASSEITTSADGESFAIAYVDIDTLFFKYKYYDDKNKEFRSKKDQAQKQLETRGQRLESEMMGYQRRAQAGLMSQNDIKKAEEELMRKQQEFQAYTQSLSAGLMEEENAIQKELYDAIYNYLQEYNKDKGFKVILNYTKGGGIWLADEALDITEDVVNGLNKAYENKKSAEGK